MTVQILHIINHFLEEKINLIALDNGSRLAIVLPFPGNDPVGAVKDSVSVINA